MLTTRVLHLTWEDRDTHRWMAPVAAAGAVLAVVMAVFGVPPLNLHGPLHHAGIMGPLCGMTRATRHMARFEIATAVRYNPAVLLLASFGVVAIGRWAWGHMTGRWLRMAIEYRRSVVLATAVLLVAHVARQQANVDLLLG